MSIIESIKKARENGQSDDQILSEIIRQNEEKAPVFQKAKERGASSTEIINEIIEQNSPNSRKTVFTKEMQEEEDREREQFLRRMDSREKGEPLEEELPPSPEPKPIPLEEDPYSEEIPPEEDSDGIFPPEEKKEFAASEEDFSFPKENNFSESIPQKPKNEDKMWVRMIIVLVLVAIIAMVLGFFYWALILKPPVVEREIINPVLIEKEVSVPHAPKPLIKINPAVDDVSRFIVNTNEEYKIILRNSSKKKLTTQLTHIIIEDHRSEDPRIINLEDFFSLFAIKPPTGFFDLIEKDFTFLLYPEREENRFAFVARIKTGENRSETEKNRENFEWIVMRPWEVNIERDLKELFSFIGVTFPENNSELLQKEYSNYKIRYREAPQRERSSVIVNRGFTFPIYSHPSLEEGSTITTVQARSEHFVADEEGDFYKIILKEAEETINEEEVTEIEEVTGWIEKKNVTFQGAYLEDVGIYYTITGNRFIFAMSFEGVKSIIDRL